MSAVLEVQNNTYRLLAEGECAEIRIHFEITECERRFIESRDKNHDIHSSSGLGIVRGVSVLDYLGTGVSEEMSGYVLCGFELPLFLKAPVYMGDWVTLRIERLDGNRRITRVSVVLRRGDTTILENNIVLMDINTFKRKMKK